MACSEQRVGKRHAKAPGKMVVAQVRASRKAASFGPEKIFGPAGSLLTATACMMLSIIRATAGEASR
jgi:hypothetical protein